MDKARQSAPYEDDAGRAADLPTAPRAPDLDLDRLVWDPEYRAAMRPWLAGER